MRRCTKCKKVKGIGEFYWYNSTQKYETFCKTCKNKARQDWYRKNKERDCFRRKEWSHSEQGKIKERKRLKERYYQDKDRCVVRAKTRYAVKIGLIKKESCQICGNPKSEAHHYKGYNYPLEVQWFCRQHHWDVEGRSLGSINKSPLTPQGDKK